MLNNNKKQTSNFAVTCSLLSQFMKEKGRSLGDVMGKSVPTTMNLLPGLDADKSEQTATKPSTDLFSQLAGFGTTQPPVNNREPEKAQLTIFYGGKVLVFDNFAADKANELMQLAGKGTGITKGSETANQFGFAPSSSVPAAATVQSCVQRPTQPIVSDLPIARKASLHRFLAKRKDRIHAMVPYQGKEKDSPLSAANDKTKESQPWLELAPQVALPSLVAKSSR